MFRGAIAVLTLLLPPSAFAQSCPEPLASATRLVFVVSDGFSNKNATVQRFERATAGQPWRAASEATPALIGHNGVGWAQAFRSLARRGEPMKVEGDKKAPAGFYKIGASFGFAAASRPNYLQVKEGTVCVDDAGSPAYNTVTTRAKVGAAVHGENMWRVPAYRRGLLVDYPSDARTRAGSCIFMHLRLPDATGTSGCVALPEADLMAVQEFAQAGAVLAILPHLAKERLGSCLPN